MSVGDIAVSQPSGSHQGLICKMDFVMRLIAVTQALQHQDSIVHARFFDVDWGETAFQRGVFLDVLVELIQRGRADALQFAARQGRFEHVGRIHRALGCSRSDDGVQFVDHQDDFTLRALHFLDGRFQAFFELAAET